MAWLLENWPQICEGFLAAYGLVAIIVRITPTKKDDKMLAALRPTLAKLEAAAKQVEIASTTPGNGQT